MSRELRFDINNDYPDFNLQNPLLKNLRACKKIIPINGRIVTIRGEDFSATYPRIVKSDFKVPGDWQLIEVVDDGQELSTGKFHTCKKTRQHLPTIRGFYVVDGKSVW